LYGTWNGTGTGTSDWERAETELGTEIILSEIT